LSEQPLAKPKTALRKENGKKYFFIFLFFYFLLFPLFPAKGIPHAQTPVALPHSPSSLPLPSFLSYPSPSSLLAPSPFPLLYINPKLSTYRGEERGGRGEGEERGGRGRRRGRGGKRESERGIYVAGEPSDVRSLIDPLEPEL